MIANVDLTSALKAAEAVANKNADFRFILALIIGGFFMVWAIRYLINQNNDLVKRLQEEQDCYESKLEVQVSAANKTREDLTVAIIRNTDALDRNTRVVELFDRLLIRNPESTSAIDLYRESQSPHPSSPSGPS